MSFRKLRLIPEHMFQRLNQEPVPRSLDFGDEDNAVVLDLTSDIQPVLKDKSKPIQERVRMVHQHLIRKLTADSDSLKVKEQAKGKTSDKKESTKATNDEKKEGDKVPEDKKGKDELIQQQQQQESREANSRRVAIFQRNQLMGAKVG